MNAKINAQQSLKLAIARFSSIHLRWLIASITLAIVLCQSHVAAAAPMYTLLNLGNLGQPFTQAYGINSSGQVVGYSEVSPGVDQAFRTAPNSPITPADDLGTLGGPTSICSTESTTVAKWSEIRPSPAAPRRWHFALPPTARSRQQTPWAPWAVR